MDGDLVVGGRVRDLAQVREVVVMPAVEEDGELHVGEKDIPLVCGLPVDIHLVGVENPAFLVDGGGGRDPGLREAAGHYEHVPEVLPPEPQGEEVPAVVDVAGHQAVDLHQALPGLAEGGHEGDAVRLELDGALRRRVV